MARPRKRKDPAEVLSERLTKILRYTATEFDLTKPEVMGVLYEILTGVAWEHIPLTVEEDESDDDDEEEEEDSPGGAP